jgi:uncharacterized protein YciI
LRLRARVAITLVLVAMAFGSRTAVRAVDEAPPKMKRYFLALLYKGPAWAPGETPEILRLQEGHMANIRRLADEGKLVLAGPFEDAGDLRGLFVLDAPSLEEARSLCARDPAVQAGRLRADVHAWWAPEGVGASRSGPQAKSPTQEGNP